MSNALTEARDGLRDLLAAKVDGLTVHSVLPERVTPPFAYVAPDEPYLTFDGANFGAAIAHFRVGAVVKAGTNDKRAADVDQLALDILAALDDEANVAGYVVESVGEPGVLTLRGSGDHLALPINVWVEIRP